MKFHKEGRKLCLVVLAIVTIIFLTMLYTVQNWNIFHYLLIIVLYVFTAALASFFRIPRRIFCEDSEQLIAPADGTIVTIEETYEKEYIKDDCIQISIFMSAANVHVNRYPVDGLVEYVKYHRGNYFVASYPKSSTLNERTSVGMLLDSGHRILIRQVAGVMARRICCYAREGERVKQNQEMGFIKFGSRVDIFVPKSFELNVDLQDTVKNAVSTIARIK